MDRGISRVERPLIKNLLGGACSLLLMPLIIAYIALVIVLYLVLLLVTSPWTLFFYSSNWGLLSRDRKMTRVCAEQIQTTNLTVNDMLTYIKRPARVSKSVNLRFYPHKAECWCFCVPGLASGQGTDYTYPLLTELLMRLEDSGWKRKDIYDLFAQMTSDGATRQKINDVKHRVCRGEIKTKMLRMWTPSLALLEAWIGAPPNMWRGNQVVVDVDMTDTKWILARHALIRPRDVETRGALATLNRHLGMWKIVRTEDDLRVQGYWQYIVLGSGTN